MQVETAGILPAPAWTEGTRWSVEQRQVIDDLARNLLVLAPAGTGKTDALARRVVNILQEELAAPEEILCLTFTNRACREMRERVAQAVGEAASRLTVRTIHGYCYDLLREYGALAGEGGPVPVICDDEDTLEMLRLLLARAIGGERAAEKAAASARAAQNFIELCKHQMAREGVYDLCQAVALTLERDGETLRGRICVDAGFRPDPALFMLLQQEGVWLLSEYQAALGRDNAYDFTDLVLHACRLLENDQVRDLLTHRYRYLHVDEVQDISDIEYTLLIGLAGKAVLLFCGDVNQTIYSWRGSAPEEILPAFCRVHHARRITFQKNYRSNEELLNLAERFAAHAFAGGLSPERITPLQACHMGECDTPTEEIHWIYQQLCALPVEGDYGRVAILGRSNRVCQQIADGFDHCRQQGDQVRYLLAGEFRLFKSREVKDILAFLRFLLNPRDSGSLRRIVEGYSRGIGRGTVDQIMDENRSAPGAALADFADAATFASGDFFGPLIDALDTGRVVVFDVESTGLDVFRDNIIQIAAARIAPDGSSTERFERFLCPQRPVGNSAAVHGFSDAFLRENGVAPAVALREFCDFAAETVIVGHNVGYDMRILQSELARYQLPPIKIQYVYDTLDIAKRYIFGLKNYKLETLAAHFATETKPSHNAMDDILATAGLLCRLCKDHLLPETEARRLFYARYLSRFEKVKTGIQTLRQMAQTLPAPKFVRELVVQFGIRKKYLRDDQRLLNIESFLAFVEDGLCRGENSLEDLGEILCCAALSSSELDRMTRAAKKLAIITVHQAKGCEFDYVFLPSLIEGGFPNLAAVRSNKLHEEARLFYVALTRARKQLFLSWYRRDARGGETKKSRFLQML